MSKRKLENKNKIVRNYSREIVSLCDVKGNEAVELFRWDTLVLSGYTFFTIFDLLENGIELFTGSFLLVEGIASTYTKQNLEKHEKKN